MLTFEKFDNELNMIKRLKELQLRAIALVGTVFVSLLVGVCNVVTQLVYDKFFK